MIIDSFLPNPVGSDKEGELFTIFNNSNSNVSLNGWQVKDEAGKSFWLFGQLGENEQVSFSLNKHPLTLNNDGETLFLYNPQGNLEDQLSYIGKAGEGQVIKKELEITKEIREQLFEEYAYKPLEANVLNSSAQSPVFLSFVFATILASLAVSLLKRIPESEEEEILKQYNEKAEKNI